MSQPFVGEIRLFGGTFAPSGWAFCDGSLVAISQNPTLYQLLGTTYGGDGTNTFALPDMRGRFPLHQSPSYPLGQSGGTETVALTTQQLPPHTHAIGTGSVGTADAPTGNVWAASTAVRQFAPGSDGTTMAAPVVGTAGAGQSHENMPPFVAMSFIISLLGIFPSA